MAQRTAADIGLANRRHFDRRQDACVHADAFERVLHCQRIHHRRQHAHIVGAGAFHALRGGPHAPENISAADHQRQFNAEFFGFLHFGRNAFHRVIVDAVLTGAHQRFAADFQQDAAVPKGLGSG